MNIFVKKDYYTIAIIIFLIFISAFLRFPQIDYSLWMDEGYSFLSAKNFIETGLHQMPSGVFYNIHSQFYTYLQSLSLYIGGENEWGLRGLSFIFGSLFSGIIFLFLHYYIKLSFIFSFTITFLLSISSWEISWSAQGRYYMLLQFLFTLTIFSFYFLGNIFYTYIHDKKYKKIKYKKLLFASILSFILFLATFNTHLFGKILIPIFFIGMSVLFFIRLFSKHTLMKKVLSLLPFSIIIIFYLFAIILDFLNFSHNFWKYSSFFLFQHTGIFLLFIFSCIIFSFINIHQNKNKNKNLIQLSLWSFLGISLPFFALCFSIEPAAYRYVFSSYPFFYIFIFTTFSLFFSSDAINKKIQNIITRNNKIFHFIFSLGIICIVFQEYQKTFSTFSSQIFLESDIADENKNNLLYTPQPDFKSAFQFIKNNITPDEKIITSNPEIAYFYQINPNISLPFDWEKQKDWEILQTEKPEYANIPYFYSLQELENYIKKNSGYIILDGYALQKMPKKIQEYISLNFSLIFEKRENEYSLILIYKF